MFKNIFGKRNERSGLTGAIAQQDIKALIAGQGENNEKIFMEEPAELIQAISKFSREANTQRRANLIEEMADVLIILECICDYWHIMPSEVYLRLSHKMRRNLERIGAGHGE